MRATDWTEDSRLAHEEATRHAVARQKRYALAFEMREEGHSLAEIQERTGVPKSTLNVLFRGQGRRT